MNSKIKTILLFSSSSQPAAWIGGPASVEEITLHLKKVEKTAKVYVHHYCKIEHGAYGNLKSA